LNARVLFKSYQYDYHIEIFLNENIDNLSGSTVAVVVLRILPIGWIEWNDKEKQALEIYRNKLLSNQFTEYNI
jgi:hypothetical protein